MQGAHSLPQSHNTSPGISFVPHILLMGSVDTSLTQASSVFTRISRWMTDARDVSIESTLDACDWFDSRAPLLDQHTSVASTQEQSVEESQREVDTTVPIARVPNTSIMADTVVTAQIVNSSRPTEIDLLYCPSSANR